MSTRRTPVPVAVRDGSTVANITRRGGPIENPLLGDYGVSLDLLLGGNFILDDVPWMRKRPILDLINGLRQLGANANCVSDTGCRPVAIKGQRYNDKECILMAVEGI